MKWHARTTAFRVPYNKTEVFSSMASEILDGTGLLLRFQIH